jgi:putative zinc finger/helix-turn-helix YgiT family protein
MNCAECGSDLVAVERNAVIRYDMGGLPHVTLRGVEMRRCGACGDVITKIPRIGQLHRVLADYIIRQPRLLLGSEIRFLRTHLGLSTEDFAHQMGVTRETVSRWQNDKERMGPSADHLLRALVTSHQPSENYAVDDLLRDLPDTLSPAKPKAVNVSVQNATTGWKLEPGAASGHRYAASPLASRKGTAQSLLDADRGE